MLKKKSKIILTLVIISVFLFPALNGQVVSSNDSTSVRSNDDISFSSSFVQNDSTQVDSLSNKPAETLNDIVKYTAKDTIRTNVINQKVYLYNKAEVNYGDINLTAGKIFIDWSTSTIHATGIPDSTGTTTQRPVFTQAGKVYETDTIAYNFKSERGLIYQVRTEEGEGYLTGKKVKKEGDDVIYVKNGYFTTDKKEHPDYYLWANKIKVVPGSEIITSFTQMYLADVPTPLILPFGYFPTTENRRSGLIFPSFNFTETQGYALQNGGYYWSVSDYFDLMITADIYTNGSNGMRVKSNYAKRYNFRGALDFRYETIIQGIEGRKDYSKRNNYMISWSHSQDQKSNPNMRFSASVNMSSSSYFKESYNQVNNDNHLQNSMSSSISIVKSWDDLPFRLSITAQHTQNNNTEEVDLTLPSLRFDVDRQFPFAPKNGAKKTWYQNIGLSYSMRAENKITTADSLMFKPQMFDSMKNGIEHSIPVSTSFKLFKFFTISPSISYKERWYFNTVEKKWDDENNMEITDTIPGFARTNQYSFSAGTSTVIYGMYNFGKNSKVQALRHVIKPSVSYSYSPDFGDPNLGNIDYYKQGPLGEVKEYSKFQNGVYGYASGGLSSAVSMSLKNTFEMKVASDSTDEGSKKIKILENLNFSTSYNMASPDFKWSPLRITGGTSLFDRNMSVNFNANLDPYAIVKDDDVDRWVRIPEYNFDHVGDPFRLTQAGFTVNYRFTSKKGKDKDGNKDEIENSGQGSNRFTEDEGQDRDRGTEENDNAVKAIMGYLDYSVPWSFNINYSFRYENPTNQAKVVNTLNFNGNLKVTEKWDFGFSSGYDFDKHGLSYTRLNFNRDMDSWVMKFEWVPFGPRSTYYFFIGIKASMLQDVKYEKRKLPDNLL
ncbi:MAG: LPS-assembly protein LptD [Flavobacteriales bacterium]|nr:LPS-assembly protein LptD [Flavobacteriales bacterium]